jgi:hypothetical protein
VGTVHKTRTIVVLAGLLIATTQSPAVTEEVVEIQLRGHYFNEPATLNITVTVAPHELNRFLRIEADSVNLFRSSVITLSGENEKRLHNIVFKNLPAGAYVLRAEVMSSSAVRGMAEQEVIVTGGGNR